MSAPRALPRMSFRQQLFLSIAVLVLVPAVIASLAIGRVVGAMETAMAAARLDACAPVSSLLITQLAERAERRAPALGNVVRFRAALQTGRPSVIERALPGALQRHSFEGAAVRLPDGDELTV